MVVYVNTKDGKIDITKEELEKIITQVAQENFDKGYKQAKNLDFIYPNCATCIFKSGYPSYPWNTPYTATVGDLSGTNTVTVGDTDFHAEIKDMEK